MEVGKALMMQHDGMFQLATETNTISEYTNSVLFMAAVLMAHSSEEQEARMLQFVTTKAQAIRASTPKENVNGH